MTEDELLDTLRGTFKPTHPVLLGQAFGRVLEKPARYAVPNGYIVQANGEQFSFGADVMKEPLALLDCCGVFEAKAVKHYGAHEVASKADHIVGAQLFEFKTTLGSFDIDRYCNSYQWRLMVDAFKPNRVTYRVFCLDEAFNGVISLKSIESFHLYPYDELHRDCAQLVQECAEYCFMRGLGPLLTQRQIDAA